MFESLKTNKDIGPLRTLCEGSHSSTNEERNEVITHDFKELDVKEEEISNMEKVWLKIFITEMIIIVV